METQGEAKTGEIAEPPKESRLGITTRLKADGRWEQACLLRDKIIRERRAEGMAQHLARDAAWIETERMFPPLPAVEEESEAEPIEEEGDDPEEIDPLDITEADDDLLDRLAAVPIDWERDVRWVYQYAAHPRASIHTAPSLSAWWLLGYARDDRAKFASIASALLAPAKVKQSTPVDPSQVSQDPGLSELSKMIE